MSHKIESHPHLQLSLGAFFRTVSI